MQITTVTSPAGVGRMAPLTTGRVKVRPGLVQRFTRAVEDSNWDGEFLRWEGRLNGLCLVVIVLSALYLAPLLFSALMK